MTTEPVRIRIAHNAVVTVLARTSHRGVLTGRAGSPNVEIYNVCIADQVVEGKWRGDGRCETTAAVRRGSPLHTALRLLVRQHMRAAAAERASREADARRTDTSYFRARRAASRLDQVNSQVDSDPLCGGVTVVAISVT